MDLTISLAQIDIALGDQETNLSAAEYYVAEAARLGSDIILFPELWTTAYDLEHAQMQGMTTEGAALPRMAGLAKKHNIMIGGSYLETRGGQAYNTFVLHTSTGDEAARYRKIHLFRLMDEDKWLCPGESTKMLDLPFGRVGLSICYDLRFPELFRGYAVGGTEIIFLVAEWPTKRIDHWRTLLRARAIENQMFVAAVNRVGISKGEAFGGRSVLLTPWGEPILEGGSTEVLLTGKINLAEVDAVRKKIPVFKDRRPEIYD